MKTYTIEQAEIKRGNGYGQYLITGIVNGVKLTVRTTDSEAFDYFNDEEYPDKQQDAIAHVNMKLELAYDNL